MTDVIVAKMERLRGGASPRMMDLFAGCGGLSVGFDAAGFELVGAVELDQAAVSTYSRNLGQGGSKEFRHRLARVRNMTDPPEEALGDLAEASAPRESLVDVLTGGPPCQAFARIGKAKLRALVESANDPAAAQARLIDDRVDLHERYLHYIQVLQPLAILIENVPDFLNYEGRNLAEAICESLENLGYRGRYTLLNAARYGVPQFRQRMFLVAFHQDLDARIEWPAPICTPGVPTGYRNHRDSALGEFKRWRQQPALLSDHGPRYFDTRERTVVEGLHWSTVTARNALEDLPALPALEWLDSYESRQWPRNLSHRREY